MYHPSMKPHCPFFDLCGQQFFISVPDAVSKVELSSNTRLKLRNYLFCLHMEGEIPVSPVSGFVSGGETLVAVSAFACVTNFLVI